MPKRKTMEHENCLIIDQDLCAKCDIANDNWGRLGVTPFTVACYAYQAIHTLAKHPLVVTNALMNDWDSLVWKYSPISITLWNKLFNGVELRDDEWRKILFPLVYIDSIETCITSQSSKKECYPVFYSQSRNVPNELLVVTKESYTKTSINRTSTKVTAYRYGEVTKIPNLIEGLRKEVTKVIIPLE